MRGRLFSLCLGALTGVVSTAVAGGLLLTQGTVILDLKSQDGYQFAAINTSRDACGAGAGCADGEADTEGDARERSKAAAEARRLAENEAAAEEELYEGDGVSPEELIVIELAAACGLEPDALTQTAERFSGQLGEVVGVYTLAAASAGAGTVTTQILHLTTSREVLCADGQYYFIPTGQRSGRIGLVPG